MTILPISAASIVAPTAGTSAATASATATTGSQSLFAKGLDQVQALQDSANVASQGVATGGLTNIHDFTTAAAKASLGVELTVALRNKAVEAYQEIMRMQI